MLRKPRSLRKPAAILAVTAAGLLSAAALTGTAAQAATAHPARPQALAAAAKPAANDYLLINANSDYARFNSTSGLWRLASGTYTVVTYSCLNSGCTEFNIVDTDNGDCMGWVNGTGVNNQSNCSLSRSKWWSDPGASGYEFIFNGLAQSDGDPSFLTGASVGGNLTLTNATIVPPQADADWTFTP